MSYRHQIRILPVKFAPYDNNFNDRVVEQIFYELHTLDTTTNQVVISPRLTLNVPPPDPNNFVPFKSIRYLDMLVWINASVDVVALQNENISKL